MKDISASQTRRESLPLTSIVTLRATSNRSAIAINGVTLGERIVISRLVSPSLIKLWFLASRYLGSLIFHPAQANYLLERT
jgi:hypothetical protein